MIIGSGLIARAFEKKFMNRTDVCIYAAGVSNSSCMNTIEFARERKRLIAALKSNWSADAFVYFGTCSVDDPDVQCTHYVQHKIAMEQLVFQHPHPLIIRLPQLAGETPNPHTLLNFLYARIARSESFSVWRYAYRNIIDVDDVATLASLLVGNPSIHNCIVNLANPRSYSILEIVTAVERMVGKAAVFEIVKKGCYYEIDVTTMLTVLPQTRIIFDDHYLDRVIRKYYGNI